MLNTTDINRVLAQYDLGTLQNSSTPRRGNVNETAFIETSKGKFVMRRNHRTHTDLSQRYRHRLLTRLYGEGFPSPGLLPTRDGDTLLTLDGRRYEVMTFIQGGNYCPDCPHHQTSVGTTLAHYHALVQDFPAPPADVERRYQPRDVLRMVETAMERDIMGDLSAMLAWYDTRASMLRHIWPTQEEASLRRIAIHGDIHRDNLIFANDEVVGLLDYDQVTWDIRLVDIADALVAFASVDKQATAGWGVFPGPLDRGRAERLLSAYAAVSPLSAGEIRLLLLMVEALWLEGEVARVLITPEAAPDYHMSILEQGYQLSQWLETNRASLTDQWLRIATRQASNVKMAA